MKINYKFNICTLGRHVPHRNCISAEPARGRLSLPTCLQGLSDRESLGDRAVHQSVEHATGGADRVEVRFQDQLLLRGELRHVSSFRTFSIAKSIKQRSCETHLSCITRLLRPFVIFCFIRACICRIKHYHDVWKDLRTLSHRWKRVLVPTMNAFDMGASEAIYSALNREIILEHSSPVIFMRAQKNEVEREGMRRAHIRDAVAMIDTLSYLEERVGIDLVTFGSYNVHMHLRAHSSQH